MPQPDLEPMALGLAETPWQNLPEMANSFHAERAGIEAGLRVVETVHIGRANRCRRAGDNFGTIRHLDFAAATAALRADIVGVM